MYSTIEAWFAVITGMSALGWGAPDHGVLAGVVAYYLLTDGPPERRIPFRERNR